MKKNILLLLISFSLFMAADANNWCDQNSCYVDDSCFYAKVFTGANFLDNCKKYDGNKTTYKTGYIVAASLGFCLNYGFRLEAEYAYRRNSISKIHFYGQGVSKHGHTQVSSYMGNLLWDLPQSCAFWNIQPFIGAGLGYDFQQAHSSNDRIIFHKKWNHFSWQLMAGLAYPFYCNTDISLEYKFHQGKAHFYDHSVGVGLTYKF